MTTLNVIGAGRAGRVIARRLHDAGCCDILAVCNRSLDSAQAAVDWIGHGLAVSELSRLPRAQAWLIAAPDDEIEAVAARLADLGALDAGQLAFHLSGAKPATALVALAQQGVQTASLHPLQSFAAPGLSHAGFTGTYCALEGDQAAVDRLRPWVEAIGGHAFTVASADKALYHAAAVLACNDLVALLETSLRCFEQAGLARPQAIEALQPLLRGTLDNVSRLGTVQALTGPVARGDAGVVAHHQAAIAARLPAVLPTYRALGWVALELATARGQLPAERLAALRDTLADGPPSRS
ncbi:DUF2520 domain-containing protein [Chitinivorax sp. PXF-14]|uniref:Rossmann-like and DUF2520 domain-containing protein n=1 Tax=Chitinivorax sp. PXF-14 TaxID=3230488 RepID=UPI0034654CA8